MDNKYAKIVDKCREYVTASTYRQGQEARSYTDRALMHAAERGTLPLYEVIALERVADALIELARGGQLLEPDQLAALRAVPDFVVALPELFQLDSAKTHPIKDAIRVLQDISDDLSHLTTQRASDLGPCFAALASERGEPERNTHFAQQLEDGRRALRRTLQLG